MKHPLHIFPVCSQAPVPSVGLGTLYSAWCKVAHSAAQVYVSVLALELGVFRCIVGTLVSRKQLRH